MIRFDHVFKRYPNGREALTDLTLDVGRGEMVFLTGHSGAGKSTLLKLIALIERPTRGAVLVNGQNTTTVRRSKIPAFRRQIGIVFQDHKLLMDRPVYDNVTGYTLGLYGRTPRPSDFSCVFLPNARWRLAEGMVFHMYVSAAGLGFSETVLIEAEGARRLTSTPRAMLANWPG